MPRTRNASNEALEKANYDLEEIVDKVGLKNTVELLTGICFGKAGHIQETYDEEWDWLADLWEKGGAALDGALVRIQKLRFP